MSNQRTHYVTTADGVTIGGTVHGQGPPLVFVHAGLGDGDLDWQPLRPHLTGRFTCHLPSQRGRGLSGDHPNLSFGRMVDDIIAYVDSIEEPTGLVGYSEGAILALGAVAAQPDAVSAVAAFEPGFPDFADEQQQAEIGETLAHIGELAAQGDPTAAVRALLGFTFSDEEMAVVEDTGYLQASGRYLPNLLTLFQRWTESGGLTAPDPAVLGAISTPVLVLLGSETSSPFLTASARHVADHAPNARLRQIPGAGHAAPLTHPEALADALTGFLASALQPA